MSRAGSAIDPLANRSGWIAPWPLVSPWFVMIGGLLLGHWIGYSPQLFVLMALSCLLLGWCGTKI